jgi:hypothetical protein
MTTTIARKGQTGQPTTNGGHFAAVLPRPESTVALVPAVDHADVRGNRVLGAESENPEVLRALLTVADQSVTEAIARNPYAPEDVQESIRVTNAGRPDVLWALSKNPSLTGWVIDQALADPADGGSPATARADFIGTGNISDQALARAVMSRRVTDRLAVAQRSAPTPSRMLERLSKDASVQVTRAVAANPQTPENARQRLLRSDDRATASAAAA